MNEDLLQASQDLLNASRGVQKALIRVRRLQEEILSKDLRVETEDYFAAVDLSERSLDANIRIVSHVKVALNQSRALDSPVT